MEQSIIFSPTLDERQLDREARTVDERLATAGEDVPVSFEVDDSDLDELSGSIQVAGAPAGGAGGGGMGAVGATGIASRIPKPVAGVAASAAVPVALSGAIGAGLLSEMARTSTQLQTSQQIAQQGMNRFTRELGDDLDEALGRPLADAVNDGFTNAARDVEQEGALAGINTLLTGQRPDRLGGENAVEEAGTIAGGVAGASAGIVAGGAIGSVVPVGGTAVGAAAGGILGGLGLLGGARGGGRIGAELGPKLDGINEKLPEVRSAALVGAALPVSLSGAIGVGITDRLRENNESLAEVATAGILSVGRDVWENLTNASSVLADVFGNGDDEDATGGGDGGPLSDLPGLSDFDWPDPIDFLREFEWPSASNLINRFEWPDASEFLNRFDWPSAASLRGLFEWPSASSLRSQFSWPSASSLRSMFDWPSASSIRQMFNWPSASSLRSMFDWPSASSLRGMFNWPSSSALLGDFDAPSASSIVSTLFGGVTIDGDDILSQFTFLGGDQEQTQQQPPPPTDPDPDAPDFGSPEQDPAFPGGGGRGNRPGDTTPGFGDDDDDDDDGGGFDDDDDDGGGYTPPPSGGGAGAGGGTGGGTIMATGGFVERSGRATIHAGERVLPESQVSDRGEASFDPDSIAEGIRRAGGMGGDDMSAVEDKLDRLTRAVRRLEGALDVTVEVNDREIARATSAASNTDPIARR